MSRLTARGYSSDDAQDFMDRSHQVHTTEWRVNCYRGTELLAADVPIISGTLTLDSSDPMRRRLSLELGGGEKWAPKNASSPLVPFGQRLTLWCRIDRADGTWLPWLKQGEYHVVSNVFERPSLVSTVECVDMSGAVEEYLLLGRRSFKGETLRHAVVDLVNDAVPDFVFDVDASDASQDPDRTIKSYVADAGQGRWTTVTELAQRRGHEAFFNANGDLVIRHDVTDDNDETIPGNGPDIGTVTNPVAVIRDGDTGNLMGLTATVSREGGINGVRINLHSTVPRKVRKKHDRLPVSSGGTGGDPDLGGSGDTTEWISAPITAHVTVTQDAGPVEWGGLFGRLPMVIERDVKDLKRWSNGGAETWSDDQQDAYSDARRLLHRRRGVTRYLDMTTIPLLWLEPDDKVRVRWHEADDDVRTEAHFISRVEIDLTGGAMTLKTRALNVTDPGS